MAFTKLKLGFNPKKMTPEEVSKQYSDNAFQLGHKTRLAYQLQKDMEGHIAEMDRLNKIGRSLPMVPPTAAAQSQEQK